MKKLIAILLAIATMTGTCTKWSDKKESFGYRYVTSRFKKINSCVYVNPFSKDTVYLGSDDQFHLNKP
jgi:hypothetical protein